ncbi:hypothetical protein DFH09DRAFT_1128300 [Mycena vulgaris]|nr:hypothetical protein DFH09DRAFT_1128300 [Mycena vulgaris]
MDSHIIELSSQASQAGQPRGQEFQEEDDEESEDQELEDPPKYSPLYLEVMRVIIQYVRSEHPAMISSEDSQKLRLFEALGESAQKFLACLLMRKDLKWHPIRRLIKLGVRLGLDEAGVGSVVSELCVESADVQPFALDESKMSIDDALWCLTVDQLKEIGGSHRIRFILKRQLISSLKQAVDLAHLSQAAHQVLGKCIQIPESVGRFFRRLILVYYRCKYFPHARLDAPLLEVFTGVGKRFGGFTPRIFQTDFTVGYPELVEFERRFFPNAAPLKLAATDNYLLIFDDFLGDARSHPDHKHSMIIDHCSALSDASRHILAGMILQQNLHAEFQKARCHDVFDPDTQTSSVITELCKPPDTGDTSLCYNEHQEVFLTVLQRLRREDLMEIGQNHGIKTRKKNPLKTELTSAFEKALPQRRINSPKPLKEILMPEIIKKLDELKKRTMGVHSAVHGTLDPMVKKYFERQTETPAHIARKPFHAIRQRFCETPASQ